jgi:hypothetical protein
MKLITRKQALKNEVFASFIGIWQERFDPREDPYMTTPGNYFDWELDKERFYDQIEIDSIRKKELEEFLNRRDDVTIKKYEYFGELKYNLDFKDIFIYSIEIGKILEQLSNALNSELIFILDYNVPWLSQENDFEPVIKASNYLREIGTNEEFSGAYKLSGDELAEFAANLFWIIRCNASLPYCWFSTESHQFIGDVCKHGNLHFHTYSEEIKKQLESFAKQNSLIEIDDCVEGFTGDGGIEGRQIII